MGMDPKAWDGDLVGVGPETDQHLPVGHQLLLQQVKLQSEGLSAEQLRLCLIAAWRGWLSERVVVQTALFRAGVGLAIELPKGFAPRDVLGLDGAEGD